MRSLIVLCAVVALCLVPSIASADPPGGRCPPGPSRSILEQKKKRVGSVAGRDPVEALRVAIEAEVAGDQPVRGERRADDPGPVRIGGEDRRAAIADRDPALDERIAEAVVGQAPRLGDGEEAVAI